MKYDHVQRGYSPLLFVPFIVVVTGAIALDSESEAWLIAAVTVFNLAILGLLIVFNRLHVTIDEQRVTSTFGWGWPQQVHDLDAITDVRQVRNQWWYGWGARKLATGWMYNVWGLDAVELQLNDGTTFRIGTDDVENLYATLALARRG